MTEVYTYTYNGNRSPQYNYRWYLADHQGSNRAVMDASGNILQSSYYYPYGIDFKIPSPVYIGSQAGGDGQSGLKYKYSGKEQISSGNLGWYDFGARWYDPAHARWTTPDPMAEKYYSISPYVYCASNPVNIVDPDGKEGAKYRDENGHYVVESNIVVLLEKEIDVTDNMSKKEIKIIEKKNEKIRKRNNELLAVTEKALSQQYSNTVDKNGNPVIFKFNIIGLSLEDTKGRNMGEIQKIAENNGIRAITPDRIKGSRGFGVAVAAVITSDYTTSLGWTNGVKISLSDKSYSTIAHEVGHTLKLTHPTGGANRGLMHYPPQRITPEEVSIILGKAYEKVF